MSEFAVVRPGPTEATMQPARKVGRQYENPVPTSVGGLRMMLRVLPLYFTNREERSPRRPVGPFQTDPAVFLDTPESGLRITWFGHSAMLVEIDGVRVLMDPMWDERASPFRFFGPKRFFAPTLPLEQMPQVDAVLLSHDHYDHLGEATIRQLAGRPQTREALWVTSLGVGALLRTWGVRADRIRELNWTEAARVEGRNGSVEIVSVPARHFSGRSLRNRFETLWAAFVLRGTRHRVYFGADTGPWHGFGAIAQEYGPFDLTMLEIGAYNVLWGDIHLGPDGAAEAFAAMGATGLLMPIHWGLFDLALHGWRKPIERMVELARERRFRLWSPEPGQPTEVKGAEVVSEWWRERPEV